MKLFFGHWSGLLVPLMGRGVERYFSSFIFRLFTLLEGDTEELFPSKKKVLIMKQLFFVPAK